MRFDPVGAGFVDSRYLSRASGGSMQHESNMKISNKITRQRPTAPKLRSWRVIIIRSRGEYIGSVETPDRERAEAVAIRQFALDDDQRSRLLIWERL